MWCHEKRGWCGVREKGLVWCQWKGAGMVSVERGWYGVSGKGLVWCQWKGAGVVSR